MAERTGIPGGCCEKMLPHARAIKGDSFREDRERSRRSDNCRVVSEVVTVSQPVPGEEETDITMG